MDLDSVEFAQFLNNIIEQKVKKIVQSKLLEYGIMKGYSAIVSSVNPDSTVNIKLAGDTVVIPSLKNKSNEVLIANDEVFLFSISSLSNAFIGIKK